MKRVEIKILIIWVFLLAMMFNIIACKSRQDDIKITGVYSSMYYHPESGDILGEEASIIFTKKGHYILFQQSQGEPEVPVIVPLHVSDTGISFTLPDTVVGFHGLFTGVIKQDSLLGHFTINGEDKIIKLIRKNSYWQ